MVTPQKVLPGPTAPLKGGAKPFDIEGKGALRLTKSQEETKAKPPPPPAPKMAKEAQAKPK
jgi:hypothetical protein